MKVRIKFDYSSSIKFEPRDLWIGVYWDFKPKVHYSREWDTDVLKLYICVVPTLPVCLTFKVRFIYFERTKVNKSGYVKIVSAEAASAD